MTLPSPTSSLKIDWIEAGRLESQLATRLLDAV